MQTLKARIAAGLCKTRRNAVPKVTQTLGRLTSPDHGGYDQIGEEAGLRRVVAIMPTAMTQALGLTHWKAAACRKVMGLARLTPSFISPALAIFQAKYSR